MGEVATSAPVWQMEKSSNEVTFSFGPSDAYSYFTPNTSAAAPVDSSAATEVQLLQLAEAASPPSRLTFEELQQQAQQQQQQQELQQRQPRHLHTLRSKSRLMAAAAAALALRPFQRRHSTLSGPQPQTKLQQQQQQQQAAAAAELVGGGGKQLYAWDEAEQQLLQQQQHLQQQQQQRCRAGSSRRLKTFETTWGRLLGR
ncbi:hypothetical protein ETH_00037260 [Eimeria tenella]|uniref:Uncharacterized protein n=1 Tax=Eimeria tenella TaxID=5802 RepID=U6KPY5_EIMTE|nr:hypothetical protein ETH_00037260 [Eimeria tenella]CDJ40197.1 hypothetical protein ETH_00037260 [Eimeria tenella]|eukprot:XP_013230950.1 hypothetical protein ETH_00037260 [Eimeria tenella]